MLSAIVRNLHGAPSPSRIPALLGERFPILSDLNLCAQRPNSPYALEPSGYNNMQLTKNERTLLNTFAEIATKVLGSPATTTKSGKGKRLRRSAADVAKMKIEIRAARKRKVPVSKIVKDLGITPSYIYQLDK